MTDDLERIWKELVVAYMKVLFWYLPQGTDRQPRKPSTRIADNPAEFTTSHVLKAPLGGHCLNYQSGHVSGTGSVTFCGDKTTTHSSFCLCENLKFV